MLFRLSTISVTSSRTSLTVENSCQTPSMRTREIGDAFERAQQDPAQGIAQRGAVSGLEWLDLVPAVIVAVSTVSIVNPVAPTMRTCLLESIDGTRPMHASGIARAIGPTAFGCIYRL